MANTNKQFLEFDVKTSIPASKVKLMNDKREKARTKIKNWFAEHHPDYPISFWIQGSHKNSLNIRTKDDDCDQDDGIYVDRDPNDSVDGTTLQEWILEAIKDITTENAEHKDRCVRNYYKPYNMGSYHIDYPSYYKTDDMDNPMLTVRNADLEESDPKEFSDWLVEQTDDKGQLRRLIRYMKAWCDHIDGDMLNGLTLTVLACNNYAVKDGRDDEALYYTLLGTYSGLDHKWECIMPATPGDDLLERYDSTFQTNFMNALASLINDAKKALDEESKHEATKLWKKHMGKRYPLEPKPVSVGSRAGLGSLVGNNKPYFDGTRRLS